MYKGAVDKSALFVWSFIVTQVLQPYIGAYEARQSMWFYERNRCSHLSSVNNLSTLSNRVSPKIFCYGINNEIILFLWIQ